MKKLVLILTLILPFCLQSQIIEPAPADKAVVYFVRASGLGALVNFTYFDSTKVIGKFNGPKYMRYECEPGQHLFWVRAENKDFMQADLEAGYIYLVEVVPQMGAIKASVRFEPVNSPEYKLKKIRKLLAKKEPEQFSEQELQTLQHEMAEVIARGMEKCHDEQTHIKVHNGTTFTPDQLVYIK